MKLNSARDLHIHLMGLTLEAALEAQDQADQRILERKRRGIMETVQRWVTHNSRAFLRAHAHLKGLCALDCAAEITRPHQDVAMSLEAWLYAEQVHTSFLLLAANTPIAGVCLGNL